ncbi:MAG: hypothetical protein E6G61_05265 [Actinobacteria bacterium]|nr:MAG: hypothetical protein E6G61_05265 [Actinomycetota bacterium]
MIAAARRGVPTLITVREPEPTILSALMREPRVAPKQWLKTYAAFYERILPVRFDVVVAKFEEVTSDFGAVTRRLNERFATRFREFDHTTQNVEAVFALIEERAEGPPWQPLFNQWRPPDHIARRSRGMALPSRSYGSSAPRRSARPRRARSCNGIKTQL